MSLQLKFDPNLDFQLEAVQSVVDLFDGLPRRSSEFTLGSETVPNLPIYENLSPDWLFSNILAVQNRNDPEGNLIQRSLLGITYDDGLELEGISETSWSYPSFTIEMETGTGKTYVYLRTICELRKRYGFSKFIIVVPSIAIYEGVIKNFQITQSHFRSLYANEVVNLYAYDSSQISRLRSFAASTFTEVMVITLDSFNKASNVIFKASEKLPGEKKPYEYIQETRSILILDEPQNMASDRAKSALRTLHPLFALRYSATHRESPNLVYRLTPFEAFRRRLVKKISVWGVTESENLNQPFLALESISKQPPWTAKISTYINDDGKTRQEKLVLKHGEDLHQKTGRVEHSSGYKVVNIHAGEKYVEFDNGIRLHLDEIIGPSRPVIFREQIHQTIKQHMQLQEELWSQGIKILSLFFIDRVANYTDPKGIIKTIFDEEFEKLKVDYPHFNSYLPEEVRRSYFAKKKAASGEIEIDTNPDEEAKTQAEKEAEKMAFKLIMRDKEQLLSLSETVGFIFAHSALKEGWDNPNVFQICTLNQTISELKKRQEIGRGLRLPVNQEGERIHDDFINVLTVVANESYDSYARTLQGEYYEAGDAVAPPVGNAKAVNISRNDTIFNDREFRKFWDLLAHRAEYKVNIDTDQLVKDSIIRLNKAAFPNPVIVVEKADFVQIEYTITLEKVVQNTAHILVERRRTDGGTFKQSYPLQKPNDLGKIIRDDNLNGFKIASIDPVAEQVIFDKRGVLPKSCPIQYQIQETKIPKQRVTAEARGSYPVPNLLDRVAEATNLTRPTINGIFKGLNHSQKEMLLKNPEGFIAKFIEVVSETLADHVANRIEFILRYKRQWDLDELFKPTKPFKPKGLIEASKRSLYNQIQTESGIEERFLVNRLNIDPKIVFYFKFPDGFRLKFPKIIGDYIPDWGIGRYDDSGKIVLQLVRETKGTTDLDALRFPYEKRKIICAKKHFDAIGVDFRPVKDDTAGWWYEEPNQQVFQI
jgi:type III restriction enzyme